MRSLYILYLCELFILISHKVWSLNKTNQYNHGNALTANSQNAICGELTYTNEPLCYITNRDSWTCLKAKALSMNSTTCSKFRGNEMSLRQLCRHVEICAFADPNFSCDGDYNCTIVEDGVLNCTKDDDNFFTKNCTPSLLHCKIDNMTEVMNCAGFNTIMADFKRQCLSSYENYMETHSVWYYVRLSYFDNESDSYSMLRSVHHPDWLINASKLCPEIEISLEVERDHEFTTVATVVTVCIILSIGIAYAVYEGRLKWKKRKQDLKAGVERFWAVFIASSDTIVPKAEDTVSPENCDAVSATPNTSPRSRTQCQRIAEACGFSSGLDSNLQVSQSQYTFMDLPDKNDCIFETPTIEKQRLPILINPPCYVAKYQGHSDSLHETSRTSCCTSDAEHESMMDSDSKTFHSDEKSKSYISKNADDEQDD